ERGVVLFLHGTPGTVPDQVWRLDQLKQSGLGILAIDWRGYGGSTGDPTELGLRADARAGFDFIRAAAPQSKIAVFGESLGTGPAVALARDRPVAGVLLNAPYASVRRLFELRGLPIPYRWLMKDPFDSEALVGGVTAPLLILHGTDDPAIPVAEAHRLYDAADEPNLAVTGSGRSGADRYRAAVGGEGDRRDRGRRRLAQCRQHRLALRADHLARSVDDELRRVGGCAEEARIAALTLGRLRGR